MEDIYISHPPQHLPGRLRPCVMALGFFDGIHVGHQRVIQAAKEIAENEGLELSVMTFDPHPKQVIGDSSAPMRYLTPLPMKKKIFSKLGIEKLYIVHFNSDVSVLSPDEFVHQYLIRHNVRHVVAGFDFRYGYKGAGDLHLLKSENNGAFSIHIIDKVTQDNQKIGSTLIQEMISAGRVSLVPPYLGDFYEITGKISLLYKSEISLEVRVNVIDRYVLPKKGVYAIEARVNSEVFQGVCYDISPVKVVDSKTTPSMCIHFSHLPKIYQGNDLHIKWLFWIMDEDEMTLINDCPTQAVHKYLTENMGNG